MTPERLAAMQASATRPRRTVPIVLDGDLAQAITEAQAELDLLTEAGPESGKRLNSRPKAANPRIAEIGAELEALYLKAEEATMQVVVEGLAGTPMATIRAANPPRDGNRNDMLWSLNLDGARDALLHAAIIGHRDGEDIHPVDVDWLLGWATEYQIVALEMAALGTSRGDDAVPLPRPPSTTQTSVDG